MLRKKGIVLKVVEELRKRNIIMSRDVCKLTLDLMIAVVVDETSKGGTVLLENFGKFRPRLFFRDRDVLWQVMFNRSRFWRNKCSIRKGKDFMEKYGVEVDKNNPKTKEASEKGRCPLCGAELSGNPPLCPNHGSEPFERRPDAEKEEG